MPSYRREYVPGGTYFFTVNTYRRQPLLLKDGIRRALREGISLARQSYPFDIEAWILLPDHLHCIWRLPENDRDFSIRWPLIKRHVTKHGGMEQYLAIRASQSREHRNEGVLWQRRFWEHRIRDEADYRRHVDYIHWNPVKHGYVKRVKDWPYSTFHRYVAQGVYPEDWAGMNDATVEAREFGEPAILEVG